MPISIKGTFSVTNSLGTLLASIAALGIPEIANKDRTPSRHPRMNHRVESLFFSFATHAQKLAAARFNKNNHSISAPIKEKQASYGIGFAECLFFWKLR